MAPSRKLPNELGEAIAARRRELDELWHRVEALPDDAALRDEILDAVDSLQGTVDFCAGVHGELMKWLARSDAAPMN